ncbi:DUF6520 family protein [Pedobacter sp. PLR]|uniref:DUF6520 family protein n=1 Tax=unclassified Pedobacter TaxID=2628915 RepID=UPI000ABFEA2E|nr:MULTISPECIES: DUF6520 family protein [unclassified Pedobacter]MCX2450056.1 DUF6520 family protein [Pedobacter sp. PLR]
MKSLKSTFLALAIVAGVGGAFATKAANTSSTLDPMYSWTGSNSFTGTIPQAQLHYGCSGSKAVCATGTNVDDPLDVQTIRFN